MILTLLIGVNFTKRTSSSSYLYDLRILISCASETTPLVLLGVVVMNIFYSGAVRNRSSIA